MYWEISNIEIGGKKKMMYASEESFIKDFANRTKVNYQKLSPEAYEVTQLINSMIGLLIIPEQKAYNKISDNLLDENLLIKMKDSSCLKQYTYSETLNLKQICRHLRNAIAHSHIEFVAIQPERETDPIEIESVIMKDRDDNNHFFEMKFSISLLEEFLFEFSDAVSKI